MVNFSHGYEGYLVSCKDIGITTGAIKKVYFILMNDTGTKWKALLELKRKPTYTANFRTLKAKHNCQPIFRISFTIVIIIQFLIM